MTLSTIVIAIVVAIILIYLIQAFVPLDERYKTALVLLVILVAVLYALGRL